MRACDYLAAAAELPQATLDQIAGQGGILVVAPHPDDESLGCGGLIAQACARGRDLRLVVLSDGIGSHPNSESHPPERLRILREHETVDAAGCLGLPADRIHFLRLPDRAVPSTGPEARRAACDIADIARQCDAGTILVTWAHDPHCDHQAASALVRLAREDLPGVHIYAYPIWGWNLPAGYEVEGQPQGWTLDISADVGTKARAIGAHRSQTTNLIADDPAGFCLDPQTLARFDRPFEIFLEVNK